MTKQQIQATSHSCSFCGKEEKQVEVMITGPNDADICNRCVWLCANNLLAMISDHAGSRTMPSPKDSGGDQ